MTEARGLFSIIQARMVTVMAIKETLAFTADYETCKTSKRVAKENDTCDAEILYLQAGTGPSSTAFHFHLLVEDAHSNGTATLTSFTLLTPARGIS